MKKDWEKEFVDKFTSGPFGKSGYRMWRKGVGPETVQGWLSTILSQAKAEGRREAAETVEQEMIKRVKGEDHHEYLDYLSEILDQINTKAQQ
jgi:hypothetical protein